MTSNLSTVGEAAVLAPLTTSAFVSLHTGDPGNTGATEVSTSGTGYVRKSVAFSSAVVGNTTVASNNAVVSFDPALAGWGTISYFGIWDAATAGNFRGSGTLASAKNVNLNDTARFLAGTLTITAA
jgi:hypothetical protein